MKADPYVEIEFIKDCLRKGEERKDILQKFSKKFKTGKTVRTFDERLKVANIAIQAEFDYIASKVNEGIEKAIKERTGKIMSAIERQELLSEIMKGEKKAKRPFVIDGKIMEYPEEPSHNDRIKALAELNKMDGSYAATKSEVKLDAPLAFVVQTTDPQLAKDANDFK
jgi:hypothetical protein